MARLALAIIESLDDHDHGFGWGTDRRHALIPLDGSAIAEIVDLVGGCADEIANEAAEDLARLIRRRLDLRDDEVAVVDLDDGVTDQWPSAGVADAWANDIWLGLADYLSYRRWCGLIGEELDYCMNDDVAREIVERHRIESVESVLGYLSDADPIRDPLQRALDAVSA